MRIAICNIKGEEFKKIKKVIYFYAEKRRLELVVEYYDSLLEILHSEKSFVMVFLSCKGLSSDKWEMIKKFKEENSDCAITFLSPNPSFAIEALKINAFRFLVEPTSEKELFGVIRDFFEVVGNNVFLLIKSGSDTFCTNTRDIVFIEAENKRCYIHLKDKTIKYNRTMAKTVEQIPKIHFFKVNRSFVVNGDYIGGYNSQYVFLKSGEKIRLTRNFMPDFVTDYHNYKLPLQLE